MLAAACFAFPLLALPVRFARTDLQFAQDDFYISAVDESVNWSQAENRGSLLPLVLHDGALYGIKTA